MRAAAPGELAPEIPEDGERNDAGGERRPGGLAQVERWDDCPAVSDDFETAWHFITTRVEQLIKRLESTAQTATRLEQGS